MKNKFEIDKIVKSITRRSRGAKDPQIMHPNRDWFVGIALALLVILIGGLFIQRLHLSYKSETLVPSIDIETPVTYRAEQIEKARAVIEGEKTKFAEQFGVWKIDTIDAVEFMSTEEVGQISAEEATSAEEVLTEDGDSQVSEETIILPSADISNISVQ